MIRTILFLLTFFTLFDAFSQIIPFGLLLNADGTIEVTTFEPNYNGNLDTPTQVICSSDTLIDDWRNVRYDHLMILEAPTVIYPSTLDASFEEYPNLKEYDTLMSILPAWNQSDSNFVIFNATDAAFKANQTNRFRDDIIGIGLLNDSTIPLLKKKLFQHMQKCRENFGAEEDIENLYEELSTPQFNENGKEVQDYLIDKLVYYTYDGNKLSTALGYHWNSGVESIDFTYDSLGNLTRILKEEGCFFRKDIRLEYDEKHRVIRITNTSSYFDNHTTSTITNVTFNYNSLGNVCATSTLDENGTWHTCQILILHKEHGF